MRLEQVIEQRGIRQWTEIGFSSIYYLLRKLEDRELVEVAEAVPAPKARRIFRATALGLRVAASNAQAFIVEPRTEGNALLVGVANIDERLAAVSEAREAQTPSRDPRKRSSPTPSPSYRQKGRGSRSEFSHPMMKKIDFKRSSSPTGRRAASFGSSRCQTCAMPEWIDHELFEAALERTEAERLDEVELRHLTEGLCVQTLHIGSFDDEGRRAQGTPRDVHSKRGITDGRHPPRDLPQRLSANRTGETPHGSPPAGSGRSEGGRLKDLACRARTYVASAARPSGPLWVHSHERRVERSIEA